jgi:hypothetical protein
MTKHIPAVNRCPFCNGRMVTGNPLPRSQVADDAIYCHNPDCEVRIACIGYGLDGKLAVWSIGNYVTELRSRIIPAARAHRWLRQDALPVVTLAAVAVWGDEAARLLPEVELGVSA